MTRSCPQKRSSPTHAKGAPNMPSSPALSVMSCNACRALEVVGRTPAGRRRSGPFLRSQRRAPPGCSIHALDRNAAPSPPARNGRARAGSRARKRWNRSRAHCTSGAPSGRMNGSSAIADTRAVSCRLCASLSGCLRGDSVPAALKTCGRDTTRQSTLRPCRAAIASMSPRREVGVGGHEIQIEANDFHGRPQIDRPVPAQYGSRSRRLKILPLSSRGQACREFRSGPVPCSRPGAGRSQSCTAAASPAEGRFGFDDGHQPLAKLDVRNAEHRAVPHPWHRDQHGLDFGGIDVDATGDDHVRLAIGQEQKTIGIEVTDIAEGKQRRVVRMGTGGAQLGLAVVRERRIGPLLDVDRSGRVGWQPHPGVIGNQHTRRRARVGRPSRAYANQSVAPMAAIGPASLPP